MSQCNGYITAIVEGLLVKIANCTDQEHLQNEDAKLLRIVHLGASSASFSVNAGDQHAALQNNDCIAAV